MKVELLDCIAPLNKPLSSITEVAIIIFNFVTILFLEVSIEFGEFSYIIDEDGGEVEIGLNLDGAIECCSIRVAVIIEDGTAAGKLFILVCIAQV